MKTAKDLIGSDVPGIPPLPAVYESQMRERQAKIEAGEFTLEDMPGYVYGQPPSIDTWHNLDFLDVYPKVWGRPCGKNGIGKLREVVLTEITQWEKFKYYDLDPAYFPAMADSYHSIDIGLMQEQSQMYENALEGAGVGAGVGWVTAVALAAAGSNEKSGKSINGVLGGSAFIAGTGSGKLDAKLKSKSRSTEAGDFAD